MNIHTFTSQQPFATLLRAALAFQQSVVHHTRGVPIIVGQLSEGWNLLTGKQGNAVQQRIAPIGEDRLDDKVALAGVIDEPGYIPCSTLVHA